MVLIVEILFTLAARLKIQVRHPCNVPVELTFVLVLFS